MQRTVQRVSILVAALLPVVVLGFYVLQPKTPPPETAASVVAVTQSSSTTKTATSATTPTTTQQTTKTTPSSASTSATTTPSYAYKDGTYSVTATYRVPEASAQKLGVSLTIVNDVITGAAATNMATDQTSSMYQNAFVSGYKTSVVGKSIASLQLGKVSGSSLTTAAFNDALTAIRKEAAI